MRGSCRTYIGGGEAYTPSGLSVSKFRKYFKLFSYRNTWIKRCRFLCCDRDKRE